jgi:FKBP-type peptidyl-prolyl cis-trans isomerase 2
MAEESVAKGDLILLDYDIWSEPGDKKEIVDTTDKKLAEKEKWDGQKEEYGPVPYEIGLERLPAAIDKALEGAKVGATVEKEISAGEGFGERDPKLIELFSLREIARLPELRKEDAHLDIGTTLTIDGRKGRVVSITAGRVRMDFNHPLAGKKIRAKLSVKGKVTEPAAVVSSVLEMEYGRSKEFVVEKSGKVILVKLPERAKFDMLWHASKGRVVDTLRRLLKPESVEFVEEYKTPAGAPAKTAAKDAPAKTPA